MARRKIKALNLSAIAWKTRLSGNAFEEEILSLMAEVRRLRRENSKLKKELRAQRVIDLRRREFARVAKNVHGGARGV